MTTSPAAFRSRDPQLAVFLQEYLDRIVELERLGEAREETFYPLLLDLFQIYADHRGHGDLRVLQLPRKTQDCLLDFQVWRGGRITGYVEAKRTSAELGVEAESEQVRRYRAAFPNLLLTNFRELRLYRRDLLAARVDLGRSGAAPGPLLELLDLFCDFPGDGSGSAAELAPRMALRTRILAERIRALLEADEEGASDLSGYYRAFSEHLLTGLKRGEFADLYAQTLAYGLLAARWRAPGPSTAGSRRRASRRPAACCATPSATSPSPIRRRGWRGSSTRSSTCWGASRYGRCWSARAADGGATRCWSSTRPSSSTTTAACASGAASTTRPPSWSPTSSARSTGSSRPGAGRGAASRTPWSPCSIRRRVP